MSEVGAAVRTVSRLKPSQIAGRIRKIAMQRGIGRFPDILSLSPPLNGGPYGPYPGWSTSPAYGRELRIDRPDPERLTSGMWELLHEEVDLGWPPTWQAPKPSRLWDYHLHYFDWAWNFVEEFESDEASALLTEAVLDWRHHHSLGAQPAWEAYPAARRAWNLCGLRCDDRLALPEEGFRRLLDEHHRTIQLTLETDLGGNHLIAELKALIGIDVWRADTASLTKHIRTLDRALREQVLADGGHYERSPSYHAIVLADLLDLELLLNDNGLPVPAFLTRAIREMSFWLNRIQTPSGGLPVFHDGHQHRPDDLAHLTAGEPTLRAIEHLAASGYVVIRPDERVYLVVDVGRPGPAHQPGHAHAGVGSFELWVDGDRIFRNVGTSTYAAGARRRYERSTAAQNTVTLGGQDQAELWGTFRIGRLPQVCHRVETDSSGVHLRVEHDGFRDQHGSVRHARTFEVSAGCLTITDAISTDQPATVRLHTEKTLEPRDGLLCVGRTEVHVGPDTHVKSEAVELANGFGQLIPATLVSSTWHGGPHTTRIEWG